MKTADNSSAHARVRTQQQMAEATVAWAQGLGRNEEIVRQVEAKRRRVRRRRLVANFGAVACVLLVGFVFYARLDVSGPRVVPAAATAVVSLPERQTLADGSVVEFREGARIAAAFTAEGDGARRVILANGEAHFSVRKNSSRAFIVEAGGVEVRAVGTAFSVALDQSHVAVLVTEGRVAVDAAGAGTRDGGPGISDQEPGTREEGPANKYNPRLPHSSTPMFVDAGKRMVVALAAPEADVPAPVTLAQSEMAAHLSWRAPRIRFANTTLSEAVVVFNRHSEVRLVLDPALYELRIGGVVRADNTDSFLLLLKTEFGIEPESAADGSLHLRRR